MIKLKGILFENFSLAKKLYIDTGKLDQQDVDFLTSLCNKDYTFKTLADLMLEDKKHSIKWNRDQWKKCYLQLKNYNKNIFPIEDFSFDSSNVCVSKNLIVHRENVLIEFNKWPSIAKRNLKSDIRIPRKEYEFMHLDDLLAHVNHYLSLLNNRSESVKNQIYKKIFSSNHPKFDDILEFLEDKTNLLHGTAFTKKQFYKIVKENSDYLNIVYDKNNIVIVDVTGQPGIKALGCNSLWCFTYGDEYGKAGEQWDQYSYNGHVYAIINFSEPQDSPEFIHIVVKPIFEKLKIPHYDPKQTYFPFKHDMDNSYSDDSGVYDMSNQMVYGNQYEIINGLVKHDPDALKVFTFEYI